MRENRDRQRVPSSFDAWSGWDMLWTGLFWPGLVLAGVAVVYLWRWLGL